MLIKLIDLISQIIKSIYTIIYFRQTHGEERSEIEDQIKKEEKESEEASLEDKARKIKEEMAKIKVFNDFISLRSPFCDLVKHVNKYIMSELV